MLDKDDFSVLMSLLFILLGPDAFLIFRFPIILLISSGDIAVINKLFSSGETTGIIESMFSATLSSILFLNVLLNVLGFESWF